MGVSSRSALAALVILMVAGCGQQDEGGALEEAAESDAAVIAPTGAIRFVDATQGSGLEAFVQENGNRDKPFIVESIGAGVALLDHDLDGNLDVYFANGSSLEGFPPGEAPRDALFAGDGRGAFEEVTESAGLGHDGWTCGVRAVDVEGDGDPDLFLTCFGANAFYRNGGEGVFTDATAETGLDDERWGTGACFLDHDVDGDLDLYVANYVDFDREWIEANRPTQVYRGVRAYFGPNGLPGAADVFYRNDGGVFTDVSVSAGVDGPQRHGFQAVAFDHGQDGWVDVFVANDSQANHFWRNLGDGTFVDEGERLGLARSRNGAEQAGMGVVVGDVHGDGLLDFVVTNFSEDYSTLYLGEADGFFRDATHRAGLATATLATLGWAPGLEDLDLDGDRDLFLANGHVYPQVDLFDLGTRYRQKNQIFENEGDGRFRPVAATGGLAVEACSRGAAFGDVDNDGDVDVVVANLDAGPTLLINESPRAGGWLRLRLIAASGNRDAIGARVEVTAGGRTQVVTVGAGSGFLSSNAPGLHFGLAAAAAARVRVRWPDGQEDEHAELRANSSYVLRPGGPAESAKR